LSGKKKKKKEEEKKGELKGDWKNWGNWENPLSIFTMYIGFVFYPKMQILPYINF
jgi:hypothetical protein